MSTVAETTSKPSRRKTPFWQRALPWVAGIVLVVGIAAGLQAWAFHPKKKAQVFNNSPVKDVSKVDKTVPLDPAARQVAKEFILTAVARTNLRRAYVLAGPEIKQGQTLKQWLTGNIAVVPYPADAIQAAPFKIDFSHKNHALIEVILLPKANATIRSTDFYLGMDKIGTGAAAHWVVNSWVPHVAPMIPSDSTGSG